MNRRKVLFSLPVTGLSLCMLHTVLWSIPAIRMTLRNLYNSVSPYMQDICSSVWMWLLCGSIILALTGFIVKDSMPVKKTKRFNYCTVALAAWAGLTCLEACLGRTSRGLWAPSWMRIVSLAVSIAWLLMLVRNPHVGNVSKRLRSGIVAGICLTTLPLLLQFASAIVRLFTDRALYFQSHECFSYVRYLVPAVLSLWYCQDKPSATPMKHTTFEITILMLILSFQSCTQRQNSSTSNSTTPIEYHGGFEYLIVAESRERKINYDSTVLYKYVSDSIIRIFYDLYDRINDFRSIEVVSHTQDTNSSEVINEDMCGSKNRYYVGSNERYFYYVRNMHNNSNGWIGNYSVFRYDLQHGRTDVIIPEYAAIKIERYGFMAAEARLTNDTGRVAPVDEIWMMHDVMFDWNGNVISESKNEYDFGTMIKRFGTTDELREGYPYLKGFYSSSNIQKVRNKGHSTQK